MKNFFSAIFIILLFLFVFVFIEEPKEKAPSVPAQKEEVEQIRQDVKTKEKQKEEKKTVKKEQVKKEQNKKENHKAKKFSYPSSFKKGKVTLYVNNPTLYDFPSNTPRVDACKFLINNINSSNQSIDFAVYGFDKQNDIINSLINASGRGVVLRGVSNKDEKGNSLYPQTEKLNSYADLVYDYSKKLMHNKFFIIDDKLVMTGSMNISSTGCGGYNSNSVVVIEDEKIINAFKKEFEQMHEGKFKKEKADFSTELVSLGDNIQARVVFSPSGNIYNKLIYPQIKNAKTKIRLSAFVLTHKKLVQDLIEAHQRGVKVLVIADAVGGKNYRDKIELLRQAGINVKVENWSGKNHEKTLSIDNDTLILGSANFSYSGFLNNDENAILIKNKEITSFYNGFFDKMFSSIDDYYLTHYPRAEGIESGNSCFDKQDNDYDGKIDSSDEGCTSN